MIFLCPQRTEHAPEDRKVAEVDPERFAALVIDKLNRLSEEAESTARNEEKLRSFSSSEVSGATHWAEKVCMKPCSEKYRFRFALRIWH